MKKYLPIIILFIFCTTNFVFAADLGQILNSIIKLGSKGDQVTLLQKALNDYCNSCLKLEADGNFGPKTQAALTKFQQQEGITPTGQLQVKNPTDSSSPNTSNLQTKQPKSEALGGSGNGDAIDIMRGTNFCTTIKGNRDRDGVKSCGTDTGDCKSSKKKNQETIKACQTCPDCKYIEGSCQTPLYFYKGDTDNAQTKANEGIRAVALTQNKLIEVFGSDKQSAYCSKSVKVCNGSSCGVFPVRDTGHDKESTIDMTGKVFGELNITDDVNPVSKLIVTRIEDEGKSNTKVAGTSQTKTQ